MDVKTWIETAGEPVADTCFTEGEVPPMPYIVFLDKVKVYGTDTKNMLKAHTLTVERYSLINDDNTLFEALLDDKAIEYEREKQWLKDEECYMTTYDFVLIEKY